MAVYQCLQSAGNILDRNQKDSGGMLARITKPELFCFSFPQVYRKKSHFRTKSKTLAQRLKKRGKKRRKREGKRRGNNEKKRESKNSRKPILIVLVTGANHRATGSYSRARTTNYLIIYLSCSSESTIK